MKKVSISGVITKSILLLIITIITMAVTFTMTGGLVFVGWAGLFTAIALGFMQHAALSMCRRATDGLTAFLSAVAFSMLMGVFAINSLSVGVYFIDLFADVDIQMVQEAASIAFFTVFAVTVGIVVFIPNIVRQLQSGVSQKAISIGSKVMKGLAGFFIAMSVLYAVSFIFALFGFDGLYLMVVEMFYGVSLLSIFISLLAVVMTSVYLFTTIFMIAASIGNEPKIREWSLSATFVHSAIQVFIEVFKLVLKILARSRRD